MRELAVVLAFAVAGLIFWGCPDGGSANDAGVDDAFDGAGDRDEADGGDAQDASGDDDAGDGDGEVLPDGDGLDGDGGSGDGDLGADGDPGLSFPRLGVYAVNLDGSDLRLLFDAGTRAVTHVRKQPNSSWMTATRYIKDPDGNGLAMEVEAGAGAHYDQTEVIVFDSLAPAQVFVIAGGDDGKMCANSSWTDDGKLIYIHQDHALDPNLTRLKRASFSQLPVLESIAPIPVPDNLFMPVDPHQLGPSDASGSLVFSALFEHPSGWMRPVWKMPASGEASMQATELVGCPVCIAQGGCCAWPSFAEVMGTNDPRLNHAGTAVNWMQQHPELSVDVGPFTVHPWRQHMLVFGQQSLELPTTGVADATSLAFGQWSPDDARLAYWAIEIDTVVKNRLYTMDSEGQDRQRVPLPDELCVTHPSFIGPNRLVFTAWRCGQYCSCSPEHL